MEPIIKVKNVYKYTLTENITVYDPNYLDIQFENEWLKVSYGWITVKRGYSWDGCTPKIKVFGTIIGTPDGRNDQCKTPSCIHDALYQFGVGKRENADFLFYKLLIQNKWKFAGIYYSAVMLFGKFYGNFK